MANERPYQTVDIERRGYGRRYTWLPVDQIGREAFMIDFTGAYTRPEMIDIRVDDLVRWREGEQVIQARVVDVRREAQALYVRIVDPIPLSPDVVFP